jgi:hypothetical protein
VHRDLVDAQRGVIVVVEVSPVHGDPDLGDITDHMPAPQSHCLVETDTFIAHEAIHLLDTAFRGDLSETRVGLPNGVQR